MIERFVHGSSLNDGIREGAGERTTQAGRSKGSSRRRRSQRHRRFDIARAGDGLELRRGRARGPSVMASLSVVRSLAPRGLNRRARTSSVDAPPATSHNLSIVSTNCTYSCPLPLVTRKIPYKQLSQKCLSLSEVPSMPRRGLLRRATQRSRRPTSRTLAVLRRGWSATK